MEEHFTREELLCSAIHDVPFDAVLLGLLLEGGVLEHETAARGFVVAVND